MFGSLGGPELILILVIALIVFGPRRLPDIGKSIGKMMVEFRRASNDFKRTLEEEVESEKRNLNIKPGSVMITTASDPAVGAPEPMPPSVGAGPASTGTPPTTTTAGDAVAAADFTASPHPAGTVAQDGAAQASSTEPA